MIIGALELVPLVLLAGVILYRRQQEREANREYRARYPRNADDTAAGAEGFTLDGRNGYAILMLHGSGDSPDSLRYLAQELSRAGYRISAPLLPGHGRSPKAFATTTAGDYYAFARSELASLRQSKEKVVLLGLSMGGAVVARLAAEEPDISALVLLAPYLVPPAGVRWIAQTSRAWSLIAPYLAGRGESSVHDVEASKSSRAYGTFSGGALRALVATADAGFAALPRLALPTLVINSKQDNRIPQTLSKMAIAEIRAPLEEHWVSGCGHVITIDHCKSEVKSMVLEFLVRHAG